MWLRRHVALVGQEPLMFEVSIRDNLSYGMRVPPSLHALEAAAELAQVLTRVARWHPSHRSLVNSGYRFNRGLDRGAPIEC